MNTRGGFGLLCLGWLAAMTALAVNGPVGERVWLGGPLYGVAFLLLILLVRYFPDDIFGRQGLVIGVAIGVAGRLVFIGFEPGNDINRYVWEGYIQLKGFNPYLFAPDHDALKPLAGGPMNGIWQAVNHKSFAACYPPGALLLFRAMAGIAPTLFFFKWFMLACDVAVLVILALFLKARALAPGRLLLYAANPLVIVYIAGEGHLDVLQVLGVSLALLCFARQKEGWGFLFMGLAIMSKYFAVIGLPFLVTRRNWKKSWIVLLPFGFFGVFGADGAAVFTSLATFGGTLHYNDGLTALLRFFFPEQYLAVALVLLAGYLGGVFLLIHERTHGLYLAFGGLLLCLPTLHPWYLVLVAPLLLVYPSRAWLYLMAAVVFTFPVLAVERQTGVFQEIHWLKWFEYLPFLGLLLYGCLYDGLLMRPYTFTSPQSVVVVIPVLNEAAQIERCLVGLKNRTGVTQIIVVDGGSTDDTRRIARQAGARVLQGPTGRGRQIKYGIDRAGGDVVLILHADCALKNGTFKRMLQALVRQPHSPGGAFGMCFENTDFRNRVIAALNNGRARLTGIAFGDQAQFVRRQALTPIGGFPDLLLMEDVELSLRLNAIGRPLFLPRHVQASSRRWAGNGFGGNVWLVLRLCTCYLLQRRVRGDDIRRVDTYYRAYYSKHLDRSGGDGGRHAMSRGPESGRKM